MKRFWMLVGVAVVAAAMYVAASPASQQSTGPTAKQFKALKAQVASLSKSLKSTRSEADAAVGFIADCLVSTNAGVLPVNQFGASADPLVGYQYNDGTNPTFGTTALDIDGSTPFQGAYLQGVDPTCVQALRHRLKPGNTQLPLLGERSH